jgi:hypothetical protein
MREEVDTRSRCGEDPTMHALALVLPLCAWSAPQSEPQPEFQCLLVISTDQHFEDRWYYVPAGGPTISTASEVVRGQVCALYPFFVAAARDEQGRTRVELDVRLLKPDGGVYHESEGLEAYSGPGLAGPGVLLARAYPRVSFDPGDPPGVYTVELVARDLVAGTKCSAAGRIELVEYEEGDAFEGDEDLEAWHNAYFDERDVSRAIPALRYAARSGCEAEAPFDMRGCLRAVFDDNHWLFDALKREYPALTEPQKRAALWLLARSSIDPAAFTQGFEEADRALWKATLAAHRDPLEEPIAGRLDVNELWGMYIATRRHDVLMRLCGALIHAETGVIADVTARAGEVEVPLADVVPAIVGELLGSQAKTDKSTRDYLEWLAMSEGVPEALRRQIAAILD